MPFNPDLRAVARDYLLSYYQNNAPGVLALVYGLADSAQTLENDIGGLALTNTLDLAEGALLDYWGVLVGELRDGATDPFYRRFIKARALANRSRGTNEDLIGVWLALMAPTTAIRVSTFPPATVYCHAVRSEPTLGPVYLARVRRIMEAAKAAGVALDLREVSDLPYFGFQDPPAKGFNIGRLARGF